MWCIKLVFLIAGISNLTFADVVRWDRIIVKPFPNLARIGLREKAVLLFEAEVDDFGNIKHADILNKEAVPSYLVGYSKELLLEWKIRRGGSKKISIKLIYEVVDNPKDEKNEFDVDILISKTGDILIKGYRHNIPPF